MVESIVGKTLNKGEWAEFYVMLKLLGEGKLYTADNMLKKKLDSYLDVLKIIRQEFETQVLEYIVDQDNAVVTVKPQGSEAVLATIPMQEFEDNAITLFEGLKRVKGMSVIAPDSVCEFAKVMKFLRMIFYALVFHVNLSVYRVIRKASMPRTGNCFFKL